MIVEKMIDIVFNIVNSVLSLLPDISWSVSGSAFETFLEYLRMVCYLLPMQTVAMVVYLVVAITGFRIIISLLKTIWEILPLV